MSSLVALMDQIGDTLRDALASETVQVEPRMLLNPTPPSIDVYPADPFRDGVGAGYGQINGAIYFTVRARVSTADSDAGQDFLLALMDDEDPLCVAEALLADETLNGLAASMNVEGPSGYTLFVAEGGNEGALLGCTWRLTILNAAS